jgi:hypothetical protein
MTSLLSLFIANIIFLYVAWVLYNDKDFKDFAIILKNYIIFIDLFYILYIYAWAVTR